MKEKIKEIFRSIKKFILFWGNVVFPYWIRRRRDE